jgi:hypothetical protein
MIYKSRLDEKCKTCLQHGALDSNDDKKGKMYILDFTYPFSPVQAFAFSLGLHYFDAKV